MPIQLVITSETAGQAIEEMKTFIAGAADNPLEQVKVEYDPVDGVPKAVPADTKSEDSKPETSVKSSEIVVTDTSGNEKTYKQPAAAAKQMASLVSGAGSMEEVEALDDANTTLLDVLPDKDKQTVVDAIQAKRKEFTEAAQEAEKPQGDAETEANGKLEEPEPAGESAEDGGQEPGVSDEDLAAALQSVIDVHGIPKAKEILGEHSAAKLSDLHDDIKAAFVEACSEAAAGGDADIKG